MPKTPPLLMPNDWCLQEDNTSSNMFDVEEEEEDNNQEMISNATFTVQNRDDSSQHIQNHQESQAQAISSANLFHRANTQQDHDSELDEESWETIVHGLQGEFASYLEEYSQIKRDLDNKKKKLYQEIMERKEYLEQRGAILYQRWDALKDFI
ncbi:uncharacterized protein RHIMIDRAFT_238751 [Rhizopus microsporus ATCC 52813]|uniref:Uncharacterized protein n=1 Tax=Rhizopus microsporus ATCC 52813 TaxID=1340429 RepID=A0A2G4SRD6_RHIZD|nr:uncharacterized protein RHIMIDRAFT_238751 [Rhizopus microsporus ATCC 52813]PHZ11315.1 hypothetical protein RHIMIDRAFT_238751 [Rhizopus microsporus ATCC 52813]